MQVLNVRSAVDRACKFLDAHGDAAGQQSAAAAEFAKLSVDDARVKLDSCLNRALYTGEPVPSFHEHLSMLVVTPAGLITPLHLAADHYICICMSCALLMVPGGPDPCVLSAAD